MSKKLVSPTEFQELTREEQNEAVVAVECSFEIVKEAKLKDNEVEVVVSTPRSDRMGDEVIADGWDLKAYRKNPVVLWAHGYHDPPIARAKKTWIEDGKLRAIAEFVPSDIYPFAGMILQMIKTGFINAVSVGFRAVEYEYKTDDDGKFSGYRFTKQEMLEFSFVPVPANAEALVAAKAAVSRDVTYSDTKVMWWFRPEMETGEESFEVKYQLADSSSSEDPFWEAGSNVRKLLDGQQAEYYSDVFAWHDRDADQTQKASHKFPHHFVEEDGSVGQASTTACTLIIASLNGARGGVKLSQSEKADVYNHVAQHLLDAGREVPRLRSVDIASPVPETGDVDAKTLQLLMDAFQEAALSAIKEVVREEVLPVVQRALQSRAVDQVCESFEDFDPDEIRRLVAEAIKREKDKRQLAVFGRLPQEV